MIDFWHWLAWAGPSLFLGLWLGLCLGLLLGWRLADWRAHERDDDAYARGYQAGMTRTARWGV